MRLSHLAGLSLLPVLACAQGTELPPPPNGSSSSSVGASSSSSASSTGAGGSGTGGEGGSVSGSGGAGGSGGGSGGAGGSGGGSGSGGAGGSGSTSSSSSGVGGSGGGSGGMGGGGGAPPTGTLLALAGPSGSSAEAHFNPASGWATGPVSIDFSAASLATTMGGGAVALLRRKSAVQAEDNELFWATFTPGVGLGAAQKVGNFGFAKDGPDVAQAGAASVMTFLGTDNKHYYAQLDAGAFSPFGQIPAGVGSQAFGPSASSVASDGVAGVYAVYAGDDAHIYYVNKPSPGGAWSTSNQAPTSLVVNSLRPFALVDADQDLRIFYVRQSDNRVCTVKLITPQNAWSAEETIGAASSSKSPSVAATAQGDFVVAYHGLLNEGMYFVRGKDGAWGAVTTIDVPATATTGPSAVRGLAGADAEVMYATGGKLKHARIKTNAATVVDVSGPMNVTVVSAVIVP